jgi:putative SOS response-associated peptidase YedK
MCGRYALFAEPEEIAHLFSLTLDEVERIFDLAPRYNIAPTDTVLGVTTRSGGGRRAAALKWGLIPHWASNSDFGARTINARAETVAVKPAFRDSFRGRRCLIPASGFYEWKKLARGKQPYFFSVRGGETFALAGLWDRWRGGGEGAVESCAIVTTTPNTITRQVHDRMPVIIGADDYDAWLGPGLLDRALMKRLLAPFPPEKMIGYPVSTAVSRPGKESAELVEAVGPSLTTSLELELGDGQHTGA